MPNIPHCCLPQESGPYLSPSVAGHPLRPATRRYHGGPLPRHLVDRTRAPPPAHYCFNLSAYEVLAAVSSCCPSLMDSFSCITHQSAAPYNFRYLYFPLPSLNLHVLRTPPALILSQDQTLSKNSDSWLYSTSLKYYTLYSVVNSPFNSSLLLYPATTRRNYTRLFLFCKH